MKRLAAGVGVAAVAAVALLAVLQPWERDPAPPIESAPSRPAPSERVRVEVLNSGGVSGLAGDATERLRDVGFDVVLFGNAPEFTDDSSRVFDRVGQMHQAEAVASALGIRNVLSEPDTNLYVDVSVWLGREWTAPAPVAETVASTRPWWDPRGWFGR